MSYFIHSTADKSNVSITYTLTDGTERACVSQFRSDATDVAIEAYAEAWLNSANAELAKIETDQALKKANEIVAPE